MANAANFSPFAPSPAVVNRSSVDTAKNQHCLKILSSNLDMLTKLEISGLATGSKKSFDHLVKLKHWKELSPNDQEIVRTFAEKFPQVNKSFEKKDTKDVQVLSQELHEQETSGFRDLSDKSKKAFERLSARKAWGTLSDPHRETLERFGHTFFKHIAPLQGEMPLPLPTPEPTPLVSLNDTPPCFSNLLLYTGDRFSRWDAVFKGFGVDKNRPHSKGKADVIYFTKHDHQVTWERLLYAASNGTIKIWDKIRQSATDRHSMEDLQKEQYTKLAEFVTQLDSDCHQWGYADAQLCTAQNLLDLGYSEDIQFRVLAVRLFHQSKME